MCVAQEPQRSFAGEDEPTAPRSQVKHSTTEPLQSLVRVRLGLCFKVKIGLRTRLRKKPACHGTVLN